MAEQKPVISSLTLPSGTKYYIKDAYARELIGDITGTVSGVMHYIGVTTTTLSDNATTNPIVIDGENYTVSSGDVVINGDVEYIATVSDRGTVWHEFGSTGSLKALAFKDSAAGDVSLDYMKPTGNATVDLNENATTANTTTFTVSNEVLIVATSDISYTAPVGTATVETVDATVTSNVTVR